MKAVAHRVVLDAPPFETWRFDGAYDNQQEALRIARDLGAEGYLVKVWTVTHPSYGLAAVRAWNR